MADNEKELESTLARARANLAEAEKLMADSDKAAAEFAVWRKENGITGEVADKFAAALSEEDRKKVAAEQEEWNRQIQHDLDAAVALARPKAAPGSAKRPRSYI